MPKPRDRKPFAIPSVPPVAYAGAAGAHHAEAPVPSLAARVIVRAGALFRLRGDRQVVHRRLVDRRPATPPPSNAAPGAADAGPASTFRGTTARYVAFG